MARRAGFSVLTTTIAREIGKSQREAERERIKQQRLLERIQKEEARNKIKLEMEARQRYLLEREEEVTDKNGRLREIIYDLSSTLEHTFTVDDTISFDSLRITDQFHPFFLSQELSDPEPKPKSREECLSTLKKPGSLEMLIPGVKDRYQRSLELAEISYIDYIEKFDEWLQQRRKKIQELREEYEREKQGFFHNVEQRNLEIKEFQDSYQDGDPNAVAAYNTMVLERSEYPEGFPQKFRVAYVPESKELVIEYELPGIEIIPIIGEYKYIKTKDVIEEKTRKAADIKELYQDIIASLCLRTIHEVTEADQGNHIQVVVFNGFVQTIDPATGHDIRPCLITIRTIKERFLEIDLRRIDKRICLRNLGAQLSPRPAEMQSVKPVVEFDMVDKRFVKESDIISDLDSRPNLMDLNPFEFENLVSNLFSKMGLETKQTRTAKDGGVDAVAFDNRPVLGGKVVIQAKRYKNTVTVSAVRDLFGTMMNEGANKGILVTTSGYGPDAFHFAKDKPIELIEGSGLLYLLEQVGVKAKIIFPED